MMNKTKLFMTAIIFLAYGSFGCESSVAPTGTIDTPDSEYASLVAKPFHRVDDPPPTPLVTVSVGADDLNFWPYTGTSFDGTPQDPINIVFYGHADPRDIRAALMALDGNRNIPGLPPVPPFNSTWTDAIGDVQTGYGSQEGWTGSVIQLECGLHDEARFHIRLFEVGEWTVANAHFEVLIPGTSDHQVLSWELAEQFVIADFMRSGLLDPAMPIIPAAQINDAPFRTIPAIIYNGLPAELRALAGGPLGDVADDVPIGTDGHAVILNLAGKAERIAGTTAQNLTINFGQVIPKPFCSSGPTDYVWVEGPVYLQQKVRQTRHGLYTMTFQAHGELSVTPVDPMTGEPVGETMTAHVRQNHSSMMNDSYFRASGILYQRLGGFSDDAGGLLFTYLRVTSAGRNGYTAVLRCNSDDGSPKLIADVAPAGLLSGGGACPIKR